MQVSVSMPAHHDQTSFSRVFSPWARLHDSRSGLPCARPPVETCCWPPIGGFSTSIFLYNPVWHAPRSVYLHYRHVLLLEAPGRIELLRNYFHSCLRGDCLPFQHVRFIIIFFLLRTTIKKVIYLVSKV